VAVTPEEVRSRRELAEFLEDLHRRVRESPQSIPNFKLADFLSGAAGWVDDLEGYFQNVSQPVPEQPTWSLIASIFAAAAIYE
jgi:hypothetical protein